MMQSADGGRMEAMNAEDAGAMDGMTPMEGQAETVICVKVLGDGAYQVHRKGDEQGMQDAASLDEALEIVRSLAGGEGKEDAQAVWNELAAKRDQERATL